MLYGYPTIREINILLLFCKLTLLCILSVHFVNPCFKEDFGLGLKLTVTSIIQLEFKLIFVGRWKDHLVFICDAVCMDGCTDVCRPTDVCTDVDFSSTSKGKPSLSNENAVTDFRQTWYVGSGGVSTTHMVCRHQMRTFNISFAYLF